MQEYKIPFIRNSFKRFWSEHEDELLEAVKRCGRNGDLILRQDVVEFEENLAKYVGTKYAVAVGSGTDALFLSCKALGIGPGDEVITVGHTFIASIQCIVHCGAIPILVDVGQDELIDVSQIEAAITPRTKAIIPVHFHGKVCDMDQIMLLARKYNLHVIEDACQALGSKIIVDGENFPDKEWHMAGSMGNVGCFSFNTPKLMGGWGDGGGITTDDYELAKKLTLLRNHWNMAQTSVNMPDFPTPDVVHWAYKSRMDNINAAMLNVKWKYYPQMLERRKVIADMYIDGLKTLPIRLPTYGKGDVIQEFIIRLVPFVGADGTPHEARPLFKEHMDSKGIELLIRETIPNHKVRLFGLDHYSLPVTENISNDAVRLPCYPELTNEEIGKIIITIHEFYARG